MKRTALKRKTPLARRSKKRVATDAEYAAARAAVIRRAGGMCEVRTPACPEGPHAGVHCHHRATRARGGKHDPETMVWLCGRAHDFAHNHPVEATILGMLIPSWVADDA